jgi:outer membrane autotransporter protein
MGIDAPFDIDWRAGIAGGFDRSGFNSTGTTANGAMTGAHLAGYAGRKYGSLMVSFGAGNTWYNGSINRAAAFTGFVDADRGGFSATATQAFGELAWDQPMQVILPGAVAQPFADLAFVHVGESSINESGGAAALRVSGSTQDNAYTSLGVRAATPVQFGAVSLTPDGLLGWQHAFGTVAPQTAVAFASGGMPFTVEGVPIARDAALVGAGLRYDQSRAVRFAVGYSGRLSSRVQDHQVSGTVLVRF